MEHQDIKQKPDKTEPNKWLIAALVLTISGCFSLIPITGYFSNRSMVFYTACRGNCRNIGTALKTYADNNDGHYPESLEMLTPKYLKTIPTCPSSRTNKGYIHSYKVSPDSGAFTFYCEGESHNGYGHSAPPNFPQYNSRESLLPRYKSDNDNETTPEPGQSSEEDGDSTKK